MNLEARLKRLEGTDKLDTQALQCWLEAHTTDEYRNAVAEYGQELQALTGCSAPSGPQLRAFLDGPARQTTGEQEQAFVCAWGAVSDAAHRLGAERGFSKHAVNEAEYLYWKRRMGTAEQGVERW